MTENELNSAKKILESVDKIDQQIKEKQAVLTENNVDMNTPLVDSEGFPSATIDVISVRQARHDIICLQNDRKKLVDEMNEAIVQLHQQKPATSGESQDPTEVHRTSNDPILVINSVEHNSPAFNAKFKPKDQIIQFGSLHAGNYNGFHQLKEMVQNSINKPIKVTVYRENIGEGSGTHVHRLELCPKQWSGEGVLGCTFGAVPKK
uniref:Nas2 N-terminal domain-containing protein n=1 Tax=Ditylenchus dipsaci TaxID=166011 RepID=A0A915DD80_9BILA